LLHDRNEKNWIFNWLSASTTELVKIVIYLSSQEDLTLKYTRS
jgi:hypothetical protein